MVYIYIYTYIWLIFMVNVGKYTIHGSYGNILLEIYLYLGGYQDPGSQWVNDLSFLRKGTLPLLQRLGMAQCKPIHLGIV